MVVIEYMPKHLIESHVRAGATCLNNSGKYPQNGSVRASVGAPLAERIVERQPDWSRITGCDPADYPIMGEPAPEDLPLDPA